MESKNTSSFVLPRNGLPSLEDYYKVKSSISFSPDMSASISVDEEIWSRVSRKLSPSSISELEWTSHDSSELSKNKTGDAHRGRPDSSCVTISSRGTKEKGSTNQQALQTLPKANTADTDEKYRVFVPVGQIGTDGFQKFEGKVMATDDDDENGTYTIQEPQWISYSPKSFFKSRLQSENLSWPPTSSSYNPTLLDSRHIGDQYTASLKSQEAQFKAWIQLRSNRSATRMEPQSYQQRYGFGDQKKFRTPNIAGNSTGTHARDLKSMPPMRPMVPLPPNASKLSRRSKRVKEKRPLSLPSIFNKEAWPPLVQDKKPFAFSAEAPAFVPRSATSSPWALGSLPQTPTKQAPAEVLHSANKKWVSPIAEENQKFNYAQKQFVHMGFQDSPAVPKTTAEFIAIKHATIQDKSLYIKKKMEIAEIEATTVKVRPLFEGKPVWQDGGSAVLADQTFWQPLVSMPGASNGPWPGKRSLKQEAYDRVQHGLPRRLPWPRMRAYDADSKALAWENGEPIVFSEFDSVWVRPAEDKEKDKNDGSAEEINVEIGKHCLGKTLLEELDN